MGRPTPVAISVPSAARHDLVLAVKNPLVWQFLDSRSGSAIFSYASAPHDGMIAEGYAAVYAVGQTQLGTVQQVLDGALLVAGEPR